MKENRDGRFYYPEQWNEADKRLLEWLDGKVKEAREAYEGGCSRSKAPRHTDIALGRLRAYKRVRAKILDRHADPERVLDTNGER